MCLREVIDMKKLCFIWVACVVFYNSSVLAKKGPFFWEATKQGRVISILATAHDFVTLQEIQCSKKIIQSLGESSLVWTEADLQKLTKEFEEIKDLSRQKKMDTTGRDYQSLDPISREFFESRQDKSELQKLSHYGLLEKLDSECIVEHQEYINNIVPQVTDKIETQWGELDTQIQTLAREKNIPLEFLDTGFPLLSQSLLSHNSFYVFADKIFIDRAVKNFKTNCTQHRMKRRLHIHKNLVKKIKRRFLLGYQVSASNLSLNVIRTISQITILKKRKYISQNKTQLNERNEYWLEKLLSAHQKHQKMFVAAGVSHFITGPMGEHGKTILDMLKEQGFEIKRYNTKCLAKAAKKQLRGEDR